MIFFRSSIPRLKLVREIINHRPQEITLASFANDVKSSCSLRKADGSWQCHHCQPGRPQTSTFRMIQVLCETRYSHAFSKRLACLKEKNVKNFTLKKMLHDLQRLNVITLVANLKPSSHINYLLNSEMIINNMIFIFDRLSCSITMATSCSLVWGEFRCWVTVEWRGQLLRI